MPLERVAALRLWRWRRLREALAEARRSARWGSPHARGPDGRIQLLPRQPGAAAIRRPPSPAPPKKPRSPRLRLAPTRVPHIQRDTSPLRPNTCLTKLIIPGARKPTKKKKKGKKTTNVNKTDEERERARGKDAEKQTQSAFDRPVYFLPLRFCKGGDGNI